MKKLVILIALIQVAFLMEINCQLTNSLEEYYKLDETSGQAVNSVSPGVNNSSSLTATRGATGKIGNAFSFNGVSQRVDFADHTNWTITTTSSLSISVWIYLTGDIASNGYANIWGHQDGPQLFLQKDGVKYKIGWYAGNNTPVSTNAMLFLLNTWEHIVITKNGSNVNIYRNGTNVGTLTATDIDVNPSAVFIGADSHSSYEAFKGRIDELGIWKRTLSASEVSQLYNSGNGWTYPSGTPSAPSGLTTTVASCSQVNLSWTDNSANETGFYIYRGGSQIASVGAGVTSYSSTGLSASTAYSYYIVAYNGSGNSGNSNTASATTPACASVPTAPSGLTATVTSCSQVNLSWTDNSTNATGFYIYRGGSQIASVGSGVTSYNNTGLSASTVYSYYVIAYNGTGNSANSNTASATTPACSGTSDNLGNHTATQNIKLGSYWLSGDEGNEGIRINPSGNVGIGTSTDFRGLLTVNGKIYAEEVEVVSSITSDFVFEPAYQLMPLTDLEIYLKQHKHLPGIPSALEFKGKGQNLGEMQDLLLRKIEELTLYILEQKKIIHEQQKSINSMRIDIESLKNK